MFYVMRPFWILTLTYFCSVLYRRYVYLFPPSHTPSFKLLYGTAPVTTVRSLDIVGIYYQYKQQFHSLWYMYMIWCGCNMSKLAIGIPRELTCTRLLNDMICHYIRYGEIEKMWWAAIDGWMGADDKTMEWDGTAWDEVQCNGVEWVEGSDCNELPLKINNHTECVYSMIVKTTMNDER